MLRLSTLSIVTLSAVLAVAGCDKGPKTTAAAAPPVAAAGAAAPAAGAAAPAPAGGESFGAGVKLAETTPIAAILANPKAYAGKTVRAEGMIVDVCPKRGRRLRWPAPSLARSCGFKVVGTARWCSRSTPWAAVAEGALAVTDMSLEDSVAYAKYQAEEKGEAFDPASVTAPISVVRLDGTGALIRDKM
ncbi:MAG: hypothetical protein R3B06_27500 [Kofleriaceae bacterium]